jgi:hypothetical protein
MCPLPGFVKILPRGGRLLFRFYVVHAGMARPGENPAAAPDLEQNPVAFGLLAPIDRARSSAFKTRLYFFSCVCGCCHF